MPTTDWLLGGCVQVSLSFLRESQKQDLRLALKVLLDLDMLELSFALRVPT